MTQEESDMIRETHEGMLSIRQVLLGYEGQGGLLKEHKDLRKEVAGLKRVYLPVIAGFGLFIAAFWSFLKQKLGFPV